MIFSVLWLCALWFINFTVVDGAAFKPPLTSILQSINASTSGTAAATSLADANRCTKHGTWLTPRYKVEDCQSAMLSFYFEELSTGDKRRMEFLDRNTPPLTAWTPQRTPRKYEFGV